MDDALQMLWYGKHTSIDNAQGRDNPLLRPGYLFFEKLW